MSDVTPPKTIPFHEFVGLMALYVAMMALCIDMVLPALPIMGADLKVDTANHVQYVIGGMFVGATFGQIVYGPMSDTYGRKFTVYVGLVLFIAGSLLCLAAHNFALMMLGRVLQGFGAASPRVMSIAMTRDQYQGREMARVSSIVMGVFMFVPVLAPFIGQMILAVAPWRMLFVVFLVAAFLAMFWTNLRLPETLHEADRRAFDLKTIKAGIQEVVRNRTTLVFTLSSGLIFGALVSYISTAQQIFQDHYQVGDDFPVYFAISAISIGVASVVNTLIVRRVGMRRICNYALLAMMLASCAFLGFYIFNGYAAPLWLFMTYMPFTFFFIGLLFGNQNAIAMEPMGHLAGVAAAVIGCLSSAIAVVIGSQIGQLYNNTLVPLVGGFLVLSALAYGLQTWHNRASSPAI